MPWLACSTSKPTAGDTQPVDDFERYFPAILGDYLSYPTHKALAVGRENDGRFVFGFRTTQRSKDRAISAALECAKRASWFGFTSECQLWAVDNEVLAEQQDAAAQSER